MTANRECERLIFAMVRYLGECSAMPNYQLWIKQNLEVLFHVLILPNIAVTPSDIDDFEYEPE